MFWHTHTHTQCAHTYMLAHACTHPIILPPPPHTSVLQLRPPLCPLGEGEDSSRWSGPGLLQIRRPPEEATHELSGTRCGPRVTAKLPWFSSSRDRPGVCSSGRGQGCGAPEPWGGPPAAPRARPRPRVASRCSSAERALQPDACFQPLAEPPPRSGALDTGCPQLGLRTCLCRRVGITRAPCRHHLWV